MSVYRNGGYGVCYIRRVSSREGEGDVLVLDVTAQESPTRQDSDGRGGEHEVGDGG